MRRAGLILFALALFLAACVPIPPPAASPAVSADATAAVPPAAVEYNLGETTIKQAQFPEDSRFRNMPIRLNGVIAVPTAGSGPFPVVVILHGTHPGCPAVGEVDPWPCSVEEERANYRGFAYLAEALAAGGYVALSININAEYTFGFGEPVGGERLAQIVEKHLQALDAAARGGENGFGVDLKGAANLAQLGLVGHSRAGEFALELARNGQGKAYAAGAVLQVAPSPVTVDPAPGSPVPLGIILPMCDGDVTDQSGQVFYEAARLAPSQAAWINSVFLERANHNGFNTMLAGDPFGTRMRPDCETLLSPETQQGFLGAHAATFFDSVFGGEAAGATALRGLGMDAHLLAPERLGGLAARVAALYPAEARTVLFAPASDAELTVNRLGGQVSADAVTLHFCPEGYYTPFVKPGSEPCRRANVPVPGNPALAVVTWEKLAALRFAIPEGKGDLSRAAAISLRVAVDPLSPLNPNGKNQTFATRLTDGKGMSATVATQPNEPALRFPPGEVEPDEMFGELFTGRAPLTTLRVLLPQFQGVDLSDIREIALVFDRAQSGSLFLADLGWVDAPALAAAP